MLLPLGLRRHLRRRLAPSLASRSFSATSRSAACVSAAAPSDGSGASLRVDFEDGHSSLFHAVWLRSNCATRRQPDTGQIVRSIADLPPRSALGQVQIAGNGSEVHVRWDPDGEESTFAAAWLRDHCYDDQARASSASGRDHRSAPTARSDATAEAADTWGDVPRVSYADLSAGDDGLWALLRALNTTGLCLVTEGPATEGTVQTVAERVAPVVETIYGTVFDVRVRQGEPAINVAYTNVGLPLHMDLAYYESPPGLQLLHCVRNDASVVGGASTFLDCHVAAELLRAQDADAFEVLTRVPATFQKDHAKGRDVPASLFYRRPHIQCDPRTGAVIAVFWSPPFEGPLAAAPEDVEDYFHAYRALHDIIESEDVLRAHGTKLQLQPGQTAVFNQRRVLHGRTAFSAAAAEAGAGGVRHLQGCYVNIDEFLSRYRVLARARGVESGDVVDMDGTSGLQGLAGHEMRAGNGSWH